MAHAGTGGVSGQVHARLEEIGKSFKYLNDRFLGSLPKNFPWVFSMETLAFVKL